MSGDIIGKIVVNSVPPDMGNIVRYLSKIGKNAPEDKITKLLQSTPATIVRSIDKKRAEIVVANLRKLGADAVFIPALVENPPQEITAVTPPDSHVVEKHVKPTGSKKRIAALLVVGLALIAIMWFAAPLKKLAHNPSAFKPKAVVGVREASASSSPVGEEENTGNKTVKTLSLASYFLDKSGDPLQNYEIIHSAGFDMRLAQGLKSAMEMYAALYNTKNGLNPEINYNIKPVERNVYNAVFETKLNDSVKKFEVRVFSSPDKMTANLDALKGVLIKFTEEYKEFLAAPSSVKIYTAPSLESLSKFRDKFDYVELFDTLRQIERETTINGTDPAALFTASEIFSWIGFFKNDVEYPAPAMLAMERATGAYLLASLFAGDTASTPYYRGMLFLGLDYPLLARDEFKKTEFGRYTKHLLAYITLDAEYLENEWKKKTDESPIPGYLAGRLQFRAWAGKRAEGTYNRLIKYYPDFIFGKEMAIVSGSLSLTRAQLPSYILDMYEGHMKILDPLLDQEWMEKDFEFQADVQKRQASGKWLSIHHRILENSQKLKTGGGLLSLDFLKTYFREDILSGYQMTYKMYAERLSDKETAEELLAIVKNVYPQSDLYLGLKLDELISYEKQGPVVTFADKINMNTAGLFTLRKLMHVYNWGRTQDWDFPKIVKLLRMYKQKESQGAEGSYFLAWYYDKFLFLPLADEYLDRALAIDPYTIVYYQLKSKTDKAGEFITKGNEYFSNSYKFALLIGDWMEKRKKLDEAAIQFTRAMNMYPKEYSAYKRVAKVYEKQEQYDKAIETLKEYLKIDSSSLDAAGAEVSIAKIYLQTGKVQEAFDLMASTQESGKYSAINLYAQSAEKLGNYTLAESEYKRLAKRYGGDGFVDLVKFYLRRGDEKTAMNTLKEALRYKHFNKIMKSVIEYYDETENPDGAISLTQKLYNGKPHIYTMLYLADILADTGYYDTALGVLDSMTAQDEQPYTFALNYYKTAMEAGDFDSAKVIDELCVKLSRNPGYVETFGILLMEGGYYNEVFPVLKKAYETRNGREEVNLTLAALAYKAGNKTAEKKDWVLAKMEVTKLDDWRKTLIRFAIDDMDFATLSGKMETFAHAAEAYYAKGLEESLRGNQADALKYFTITLETTNNTYVEFSLAHETLSRIKKDREKLETEDDENV